MGRIGTKKRVKGTVNVLNADPSTLEVQTVSFNKHDWTPFKAKMWLENHGYKVNRIEVTPSNIMFRQNPPSSYVGFMVQHDVSGIDFVLGKRR